jgi:hypothetical protein
MDNQIDLETFKKYESAVSNALYGLNKNQALYVLHFLTAKLYYDFEQELMVEEFIYICNKNFSNILYELLEARQKILQSMFKDKE